MSTMRVFSHSFAFFAATALSGLTLAATLA
jgi:hypothetical protein